MVRIALLLLALGFMVPTSAIAKSKNCTHAIDLVQFVWDHPESTFERLGKVIKITLANGRVFLWIPSDTQGEFCMNPEKLKLI